MPFEERTSNVYFVLNVGIPRVARVRVTVTVRNALRVRRHRTHQKGECSAWNESEGNYNCRRYVPVYEMYARGPRWRPLPVCSDGIGRHWRPSAARLTTGSLLLEKRSGTRTSDSRDLGSPVSQFQHSQLVTTLFYLTRCRHEELSSDNSPRAHAPDTGFSSDTNSFFTASRTPDVRRTGVEAKFGKRSVWDKRFTRTVAF